MKSAILLFFCIFSLNSFAENLTVNINQLGCHINSSSCFAYVSKEIPNSSNCDNNTSLRWDGESSKNAQQAYSTLLLAFTTGKTVTFGQESCFSGYSSFTWVKINQ